MIAPPDDPLLVRAIELVREPRGPLPSAEAREQVRTALLAAAGTARPRRVPARWIIAAAAVALGGAALVIAVSVGDAGAAKHDGTAPVAVPASHATIHAVGTARFTSGALPPDEVVVLHDGTIAIEVTPLTAGERFRVAVGAASVEVRGTAFTVTADNDRLVAVRVEHGRVEVRPDGAASTLLSAGEAWGVEAATPAPPPVLPPTVVPAAPAHVRHPGRTSPPGEGGGSPSPPPTSSPPTEQPPEETSFDAGWSAMRSGDFARAANAFARTVALDPDGTLAEDASYWHGVALARIPRNDEAIVAFRGFLEHYTSSSHRGEVSAMLGWLVIDDHPDEAAALFRAAEPDPSAEVRASARAGLDRLGIK